MVRCGAALLLLAVRVSIRLNCPADVARKTVEPSGVASPADQLHSSRSCGTPPTMPHTPAHMQQQQHGGGQDVEKVGVVTVALCLHPNALQGVRATPAQCAAAPSSPLPPCPPHAHTHTHTCLHVQLSYDAVIAACQQGRARGPQPLEAADVVTVRLKQQHTIIC